MDNIISNIDGGGSGIQLNGYVTNSVIGNNTVIHASLTAESCGIFDVAGFGNAGNRLTGNRINDAYCGVASPAEDVLNGGVYLNTLYNSLNANLFPNSPPPPEEHYTSRLI